MITLYVNMSCICLFVAGESLANSFNSRYSRHSYEGVGAGPGGTRRSKQSEVREWCASTEQILHPYIMFSRASRRCLRPARRGCRRTWT